jgi:hypothetical protein
MFDMKRFLIAGGLDGGDFSDGDHPSLCVVAGATERRGSQRIARALVISSWGLVDGSSVWLDLGRSSDEAVLFTGP